MFRNLALSELFNFLPNDGDTSLVWGIQLKDALSVEILTEKFLCQSKNSRCFASSRRTVHQQVWNMTGLYAFSQSWHHFELMGYLVNFARTTIQNSVSLWWTYYFSIQGTYFGLAVAWAISVLSWFASMSTSALRCGFAFLKNASILILRDFWEFMINIRT